MKPRDFHNDEGVLRFILEAIANVTHHQENCTARFTVERAIVYELITIGEAVKDLSKGLKDQHLHVPWQTITDARNRMAHDYEDIASEIIWNIVEEHLPALKVNIETILKQMK